jgi:hypothetical protein
LFTPICQAAVILINLHIRYRERVIAVIKLILLLVQTATELKPISVIAKINFYKICVKFTLWTHCRTRGKRLEFKRSSQTNYLVDNTLNSISETNELFCRTTQCRIFWHVISWSRNTVFYATQSSLALPEKRITGKLFWSSFATTNNITKIFKVMCC